MSKQQVLVRPDDHAMAFPGHPAVIVADTGRVLTYAELVSRSKKLARTFHDRGLRPGDHIAVLMSNSPEYLETIWSARRSGLYYTPVNWHLKLDEIRYILENSQAKALVASGGFIELADEASAGLDQINVRLVHGIDRSGWDRYEESVDAASDEPFGEELEGEAMLYSSGTTGRPKGVLRNVVEGRVFGDVAGDLVWINSYGADSSSVSLGVGPLYHAAPLVSAMVMHRYGGTVVIAERFDPEKTLEFIERYKVNFAQFVPTMFVRMLRLPESIRTKYDFSSLRVVVHAAAPCPVDVKRRMLDWWGPIINEYYSATEAAGRISIGPEEWLEHPGSVGKPQPGEIAITDELGRVLGTGEDGVIWFTSPAHFEYHGDQTKTDSMYNELGWATMGDLGHLDVSGYLFLTGRLGHTIISGGVNIYPQEVEEVLLQHDAVEDVAVIGVPDEEYGEEVKAVIQPRGSAGSDELAVELTSWCRDRMAHYKCPKSIDFVTELPRTPTGKMLKRVLQDQYATAAASD